jgi:CRISPR-associated protein (Cas_Cas02710)
LNTMLKWINKNQQIISQNEILFNISSGTPAIRSTWAYLNEANLARKSSLWYSQDPHKTFTPPRIQKEGLSYFDEIRRIQSASSLMRSMAFTESEVVLRNIKKLSVTEQRVDRVNLWADLMSAYHLWDCLQYRQAGTKIKYVVESKEFLTLNNFYQELIKNQQDFLLKISHANCDNFLHIYDLYMSLSRRFKSDQYANIATRTRRVMESSVQYIALCGGKNINSSIGLRDVFDNLRDLIPLNIIHTDILNIKRSSYNFNQYKYDLIKSYYRKNSGDMNHSVETHGRVLITKDKAELLINISRFCICIATVGEVENESILESKNTTI